MKQEVLRKCDNVANIIKSAYKNVPGTSITNKFTGAKHIRVTAILNIPFKGRSIVTCLTEIYMKLEYVWCTLIHTIKSCTNGPTLTNEESVYVRRLRLAPLKPSHSLWVHVVIMGYQLRNAQMAVVRRYICNSYLEYLNSFSTWHIADLLIEYSSTASLQMLMAWHVDGVLPIGPYPPCFRMADRALLAGYPRFISGVTSHGA